MKTLFRMMALFALLAGMASCSDDDDETLVKPVLEVNYANVAGTWRLSEWNGESIDGDTRYYYITFNRKEEDGKRKYTVYTNLNSFVSERITGDFLLDTDEDLGDLISGKYDYKLSMDDEWEHTYIITNLYDDSMTWTAKEQADEVRVYTRCSEVPADIVAGTRAAQ